MRKGKEALSIGGRPTDEEVASTIKHIGNNKGVGIDNTAKEMLLSLENKWLQK